MWTFPHFSLFGGAGPTSRVARGRAKAFLTAVDCHIAHARTVFISVSPASQPWWPFSPVLMGDTL